MPSSWSISVAVFLATLVSATAHAKVGSTPTSSTVVQASVAPRSVRLPIIDQNDIRFTRLSTSEGLSQMRVSNIIQDEKGFIWFGTQYGLNRYDGYTFKVFRHEPGNASSLSGVFINSLFKDRSGTLWIGCDQLLDRFDATTETFVHYRLEAENRNSLPFAVMHISQESAGILWLATGNGLYTLDPTSGRIRNYSHDPNDPSSLSSNDIKSTGEDRMGNFWVATGEGLDRFDRRAGKVTLHIPLREPLHEFSFYQDRFGVFWIVHVSGNGLAIFDPKTNTLTHYSFYEREPPSTAISGVKTILEDRNGNLWLGTEGAGLLRFDREHRRFIAFRHNPFDPASLGEDSINCLLQDREGNIWAGLGAVGLNRFASEPLPFANLPHDLGRPNSKGETFINALHGDREGNLWVNTRETLHRIDHVTGQYNSYRIADGISIAEDRAGFLWVGTYNHGLYRFETRTKQFKAYRHVAGDPSSLSNDIVARLLVDHNGTLWAATYDGLDRFDSATDGFTTFRYDSKDKNLFYLELVEGPKGAFWLGTHASGLQRFDAATGQFSVYRHDVSQRGTLSDNRVNSVHFDHEGSMWIGTQNGLNRFDPETGSFTAYSDRDGLPGNAIGCILEDERGDLWMSTNNGVSRFNPKTKTFKNYSIPDGLPGPDLTGLGACSNSPSGQMFFGGFSGGTSFYPSKVQDSSYAPPIVLTDFRLSGNPVDIGVHSPIKNSIAYADDLILSHKQSVFSLTFAALSYSNPTTNRYRYKLEGLEREWTEVGGDRRLATYTTLPAGSYTLRVQGATRSGPWGEPGVVLRIGILPPWWSTWWFRASYVAFILLSVWYAYRYRLTQIANEFNMRLEERVSERNRIAGELHDTLLQGVLSASMQLNVANDQLGMDSPARALVGRVLELMGTVVDDGRKALHGLRISKDCAHDLELAFSRIPQELALEGVAEYRLVGEGASRPLHPIIRDEVYWIGREAVTNAFRHSGASTIEVGLQYGSDELRVSVRDDGSGIDPQVLQEGKNGHWGLSGMRERAERIGGEFKVWSSAESGTEIDLRVPGQIAFESLVSKAAPKWMTKLRSKEAKPERARRVG